MPAAMDVRAARSTTASTTRSTSILQYVLRSRGNPSSARPTISQAIACTITTFVAVAQPENRPKICFRRHLYLLPLQPWTEQLRHKHPAQQLLQLRDLLPIPPEQFVSSTAAPASQQHLHQPPTMIVILGILLLWRRRPFASRSDISRASTSVPTKRNDISYPPVLARAIQASGPFKIRSEGELLLDYHFLHATSLGFHANIPNLQRYYSNYYDRQYNERDGQRQFTSHRVLNHGNIQRQYDPT
ncbi:hypothetical protein F4680DRAFT_278652 [Xylaria scruposa]|nr:hypothetical protein F4680DRAFT_278652 [Xylaria scruposa]